MESSEPITAQVIRVTRKDTVQLRVMNPQLQSMVATYMAVEGVWCDEHADSAIVDWVEIHADHGRLQLVTFGWVRDEYGRLLGDLCDLQTGECLSDYLVEQKVATPRPHHYMETMMNLMQGKEPEEC